MNKVLFNLTTSPVILAAWLASTSISSAGLTEWQAEVNGGTVPAATLFTTTSGTSPVQVDVGLSPVTAVSNSSLMQASPASRALFSAPAAQTAIKD